MLEGTSEVSGDVKWNRVREAYAPRELGSHVVWACNRDKMSFIVKIECGDDPGPPGIIIF